MSALAEPPWCVCSACLGTPAVFTLGVMQLAALLGFPCWLTQVGCSTPAVMVLHGVGGCLVTVVLFPPCFLFCDCVASPSGFCPLTGWVGMSVSSVLVYSLVWLEGLAATFSSVPVRCFPCCRYIGFSGLLLLRLLAGVVLALHPVSGCSSCGVVCLVCRWGSPAAFSLP